MSSAPRPPRRSSLLERLPAGVQRSLAPICRLLPARLRHGPRFAEFRRLTVQAESWSLEQIAEFQIRHLRQVLIQAGNFCPFYQRRFAEARFRPEQLHSAEDLAACPLTDFQDLLRHGDEMTSAAVPARHRDSAPIRSPAGVPTVVQREYAVDRAKEAAFRQALGIRAGGPAAGSTRTAVFDPTLDFVPGADAIASLDVRADRLRLSPRLLVPERLAEYLAALAEHAPAFLELERDCAHRLLDLVDSAGAPWSTPLHAVFVGPETCTASDRERFERAFGCPVRHWFGVDEHVAFAAQGRRSPLLYFWPTYGLVEFGEPAADGFCEIIGTAFHQLAQPLVRFRTGAYARLADPARDGDLEFPWPAAAEIERRLTTDPLSPP